MRGRLGGGARLAMLAALPLVASCASDDAMEREGRPAKTTLGEEMFTALCDRVGASSLPEDLSGASYRAICHKGEKGWKGAKVATAVLPPSTAKTADARAKSIAKVEAMARRRDELIAALDALLPDEKIDDPAAPGDAKKQVRLHDALDVLAKRMTPLYEGGPFAAEGAVVPGATQSLARMLGAIEASDEATAALSRMAMRAGYRPGAVSQGAIGPLLRYPRLRRLSTVLLDRLGPGGALEPLLQQVLAVASLELEELVPDERVAAVRGDDSKKALSRPRQNIEVLSTLLLAERGVFARAKGGTRQMAARDVRGFAIPTGSVPGKVGTVPLPFADVDGDGYADVDLFGRFVGADGEPVAAPQPFMAPGSTFEGFAVDEVSGLSLRDGVPLYKVVDGEQTLLRSVLFDLRPRLATGDGGAPSTVMKALEGSYVLFGDRVSKTRAYGESALPYEGFDAKSSPMVDLVHATGQLLAARESDDFLGYVLELHEKHPEKTARGAALALRVWEKSKDARHAAAVLDDRSMFWDDMIGWLVQVSKADASHYTGPPGAKPRGLLGDMAVALASEPARTYLPGAFGTAFTKRDRVNYDPDDINGLLRDLDTGGQVSEASGLSLSVDRAAPDVGQNRSAFHRFARLIAAANHVNACNKPKSLVTSEVSFCGAKITLQYPLPPLLLPPPIGQQQYIDECELFEIRDLGIFFIDSVLPWGHPRRGRLEVKDKALVGIIDAAKTLLSLPPLGLFCDKIDIDSVLEQSTGLSGLTTTPTPQALTRLVFFGSEVFDQNGKLKYGLSGEQLDPYIGKGQKNFGLNRFISGTLDLVGTNLKNADGSLRCPPDARGVAVCAKYEDTLRGLDPYTFFVAETPRLDKHPAGCHEGCDALPGDRAFCHAECDGPSSGFYEGIRPLLTTFANYRYDPLPGDACTRGSDGRCAGEQLFIELISILDKHWPSGGSGVHRYEELVAWMLQPESDFFGTVADLVGTMDVADYTSTRVQPGAQKSGLEVTQALLTALLDPQAAAAQGVRDRAGRAEIVQNDGATKAQAATIDLLVAALKGFDARFAAAGDAEKKARWKSARSELVDTFMLADDKGWGNPAFAAALPIVGRVMREQLNTRCPDREATGQCAWASTELSKKMGAVVDGPLFAALQTLLEALRADDELRAELEALLLYLTDGGEGDQLSTVLVSLADLLQVLIDDGNLAPMLSSLSEGAKPAVEPGDGARAAGPGAAHKALVLLKALVDDTTPPEKAIDRYRVLDPVLRNLVTPVGDRGRTPLDTFVDTIADVHRLDSADEGPMAPEDYRAMMRGVRGFLVDEYRGLEQFYTIVRGRNGASQ